MNKNDESPILLNFDIPINYLPLNNNNNNNNDIDNDNIYLIILTMKSFATLPQNKLNVNYIFESKLLNNIYYKLYQYY